MTDAVHALTESFGEEAIAGDLSFLLARANALSLAAANGALAEHGLKVRSYSVLLLAGGADGPSQRRLAEYLRLDPSQVVSIVDALQERGWVQRRADPTDRRTNVVVATPSGRAVLAQARGAVQRAEASIHAGLSDEDRARLARLLRTLAFPA